MPKEFTNPGLIPDPRSLIDISKDFQMQEVIPQAVALHWNRGIEGAPVYSVRDQDGSSSCVGQAIAKALETITGVVQSAHPVYRRRSNFPIPGMFLQDGMNIIKHLGTTTEQLDPSQKMTEAQMNGDLFVQTPLTELIYVGVDYRDIDSIATAIETQKQCVLTLMSNYSEWDVVKPVVLNQDTTFGHAICGTYYFTDPTGEKCILIDESWGLKQIERRLITETFIKARGTGGKYFVPQDVILPVPKPKFTFKTQLLFGQTSSDIKNLQDILRYENLFPVASTGYYGNITARGVLQWQIKYSVDTVAVLNSLGGRTVGPKTIAKLNSIYA